MTSRTSADDLGQAAYAAYSRSTGNRTHDGREMPAWDELGQTIQRAWGAAAAAAAHTRPEQPAGSTRAKFRCTAETQTRYSSGPGQRLYRFAALYDPDQPEDQRYAAATPSGELTITVDNPACVFEPGAAYYLDITAAGS